MVAGLRARLLEQLQLEALPIDADLSEGGPSGAWGTVRSEAWRGERLRKVVLSQIAVPRVLEGWR